MQLSEGQICATAASGQLLIYVYDFNPTYMERISSVSWETADPGKH